MDLMKIIKKALGIVSPSDWYMGKVKAKRKSPASGMTTEEILRGTEAFIRQNFRAKDDTDEESPGK